MPQVDLETLVCCGDRKVTCESIIDKQAPPEKKDPPEIPPDSPAESFWVPKAEELDWFDRNAFYERKESTKGNSNSNSNTNPTSNSSSTSQRLSLSLKSKASIIGLPKPQKSCYIDFKFRRNSRPSNARFFPKKPESIGKSSVPVSEPSSPKVSCIGRVRSDKSRRWGSRRRCTEETSTAITKPKKTGYWATFLAILRSGCRDNQAVDIYEQSTDSSPRKKSSSSEHKIPASAPVAEPPGLGGMKRFVSGRRSDSFGGSDVDQGDLVESGSTDSPTIRRRRAFDHRRTLIPVATRSKRAPRFCLRVVTGGHAAVSD